MSLSDLFGDLEDEDEEEYRPQAEQISDIEEEMSGTEEIVGKQRKPSQEDLLKPMKPPEFDSDEELARDRGRLPSSSGEEETTDITQLNKNLFGSDNEPDDVPITKPVIENPDNFFKEDDDDDDEKPATKSTAQDLFGSDTEEENSDAAPPKPSTLLQTQDSTTKDIFGSDVSSSEDEKPKPAAAPPVSTSGGLFDSPDEASPTQPTTSSTAPPTVRSDGESDEDREEESELPVEMPMVNIDLGENLNLMKLPNFLSIDTRPFDADTFEDEIEDDNEVTDAEGRSRMKLRVENTIRWRYALDDQGNLKKQSNSRVVKWSDGSTSLFVGREEFDMLQAPMEGANNHLYVKHGAGIQGQAQFHNKTILRIHSTDSYTHRKLTMRISDRVNKTAKAKTLPAVGKNPESKREELCKKEEEKIAAARRRETMQKKIREKQLGKRISTRYLEPDVDDGESLAAIKNSYKKGGKGRAAAAKKKKTKAKKKKVSEVYSSEEEEEEEEEEPLLSDDEEEEAVATSGDSDDSDRGGGSKKQKKKPTVIEEDSD